MRLRRLTMPYPLSHGSRRPEMRRNRKAQLDEPLARFPRKRTTPTPSCRRTPNEVGAGAQGPSRTIIIWSAAAVSCKRQ
jgi:hypothetical protein